MNTTPLTPTSLRGNVSHRPVLDVHVHQLAANTDCASIAGLALGHSGSHGLVVLGVHTPEFGVEHSLDGVRQAARRVRQNRLPIAIDNDYGVWDAFANRYWPALYIADAEGRIRHHHFGEGGYDAQRRTSFASC